MILDQSTCVMGAQPMGAPGWPELAFSTMSAASVRIVLMHRSTGTAAA